MKLVRALSRKRREPLLIGLVRGCFGIEAAATGCAGAIALISTLALVVAILVSGWQYAVLTIGMLGVAVALIGSAVGLARLGTATFAYRIDRTWVLAFSVQLVLAAVGILAARWIDPHLQGSTEGPFADGIAGAIGLVAYTYAGCGVLSLLFCSLAAFRQIRRRPSVPGLHP
jgi:hypothetical protein